MSKIIKVETCSQCPLIRHESGMGFTSDYIKCKNGIMLKDWDGPENFDITSGIHPDCPLEDK